MMSLSGEQVARGTSKVRLGELEDAGRILLGRGKIISKNDIAACPGNYPVFSSSASGNGEIGRYGKYMFDDERITWSIDGGGRLFYRPAEKYSVTNVCGWLRVLDNKIDAKYLYFALLDAWSRLDFNYIHKAHPSVIREEYHVFLPPLSVQLAIVARLEKELAETDRLVANFRRIAERAEDEFKAKLGETVKGIVGDRVRLGAVCQLKNGYTPKAEELLEEGNTPYYRIAAMNIPGNERHLEAPTAWLKNCRRFFKAGAIVFPKNGGAAYTGKVRVLKYDSVVDLNTGVCSPSPEVNSDYLYYWLSSFDLRQTIVDGTIPFVDFGKLADAEFSLPSKETQSTIVAKLNAAKARCDKLKDSAEKGMHGAEKLRAAILAEAFEP